MNSNQARITNGVDLNKRSGNRKKIVGSKFAKAANKNI